MHPLSLLGQVALPATTEPNRTSFGVTAIVGMISLPPPKAKSEPNQFGSNQPPHTHTMQTTGLMPHQQWMGGGPADSVKKDAILNMAPLKAGGSSALQTHLPACPPILPSSGSRFSSALKLPQRLSLLSCPSFLLKRLLSLPAYLPAGEAL